MVLEIDAMCRVLYPLTIHRVIGSIFRPITLHLLDGSGIIQRQNYADITFPSFQESAQFALRKAVNLAQAGVAPRIGAIEETEVTAVVEDDIARLGCRLLIVLRQREAQWAPNLKAAAAVERYTDRCLLQFGDQCLRGTIIGQRDGLSPSIDSDVHFYCHCLVVRCLCLNLVSAA